MNPIIPADSLDFSPKFKRIPRNEIPDKIGDMPVTPALIDEYEGHEYYLKVRAKHTPECYKKFDALRLCLVRKEMDKDVCARYRDAYQPCAGQLRKARLDKMRQFEEGRRRTLLTKAKELESRASSSN